MNKRVMMERAEMVLEIKIKMAFLESYGWTREECEIKEFFRENREDYLEYREWYLVCCA